MCSFFYFNKKLHKLVEGSGMNLPLGATFANIFIRFKEAVWLSNCPISFQPIFCMRYVDDAFLLFRDHSDSLLFLDYITNKQPNIKFTNEHESTNRLMSLNCVGSRQDNKFVPSV